MSERKTTILPIQGENSDKGWRVELTTTIPLQLEDATQITQVKIVRGDGKFFEATYLPPKSEFNPQPWGQAAIIEHSQGREKVGQAIALMAPDQETGTILVAVTKPPKDKRIGAKGKKQLLEGPRASVDNLQALPELTTIQFADEPGYANTARITGDAPEGAPITLGFAVLKQPAEIEGIEWMPLQEFALQVNDLIAAGAALRALAMLQLLENLKLPN